MMRRIGGRFLEPTKIEDVIASAKSSFGMPQTNGELALIREIAAETRRNQKASRQAVRKVEELTENEGAVHNMRDVVGKKTSAVLVAAVGDPGNYDSASAYVKSLGLNLKEKSSGKHQGGLHITKRGPGIARMVLYMAVLRLIQKDVVIRAWYAKKVKRLGGRYKTKAVVAIMRKLAGALWHVAQGQVFDSTKLFNTQRLNILAAKENVS